MVSFLIRQNAFLENVSLKCIILRGLCLSILKASWILWNRKQCVLKHLAACRLLAWWIQRFWAWSSM